MKFLVISKPRAGVPAIPTAQMVRADKDYWLRLVKEGVIDCVYGFAASASGVAIVNADSAEKLHELLARSPLALFAENEVLPLIDIGRSLESVAEMIERQGR